MRSYLASEVFKEKLRAHLQGLRVPYWRRLTLITDLLFIVKDV